MSAGDSNKYIAEVRIKEEPQFVEPDSSTNSSAGTSNTHETATRQNSLQRIQLRKQKVLNIAKSINVFS